MKKILSIVVALVTIMSFTACTAASKHSEIIEEPVQQHSEKVEFIAPSVYLYALEEEAKDEMQPENNPPLWLGFQDICNIAKDGGDVKGLTFCIVGLDNQPVDGSGTDDDPYIVLLTECKLNEDVKLCNTYVKCEIEGETYLYDKSLSKVFRWNSKELADDYVNIGKEKRSIKGIENAEDLFIYVS